MPTNSLSAKGKIMGIAGFILGMVSATWALIPVVGKTAIWLAIPGLILSASAFILAGKNGNPKKSPMISGFILNLLATLLAVYWLTQ
jgi:hypothetical protein